MSKYLLEQPEGACIGDEYTAMFSSKSKTWLLDSMEFLSKLYDGSIPKYITISRGVEYVPHVYVNFLSATTFYLLKLMKTDDFFLQGTGCRFLWDVETERDFIELDHPSEGFDFFLQYDRRIERDEKLDSFVNKLVSLHIKMNNIADSCYGEIKVLDLEDEALAALTKFRVDKINQATRLFNENVLNPDVGYIARLAENAIKLAGIHCVSRCYDDQLEILDMEVSIEDVEWAIEKVEYHYEMYLKLKEIREEIQRDFSTRGHKSDFDRILWIIEKNGGRANITQIMQGTHWLRTDVTKILQAMIDSKIIEPKEIKPPRGRPSTVYIRYKHKIKEEAE